MLTNTIWPVLTVHNNLRIKLLIHENIQTALGHCLRKSLFKTSVVLKTTNEQVNGEEKGWVNYNLYVITGKQQKSW